MSLGKLVFVFFATVPLSEVHAGLPIGHRSKESARARHERKLMRHPQRLDIRFLGTEIRAEGTIGIVATVAIIGVVLAAYFGI
jgi:hypothetical protein